MLTTLYPKLFQYHSNQMNYDGILAQLTDDKLILFDNANSGTVEGCGIVEEEAAVIQTIQQKTHTKDVKNERPSASLVSTNASSSSTFTKDNSTRTTVTTSNENINQISATTTSTPQRKISTSSRFMNAFTQLYNSATNSGSIGNEQQEDIDVVSSNFTVVNRTPTKGMESKLMSMWHNVKYGWSGKIRTNFSKEQPVWLLGRCYHRRYTPPVSMDHSTELEAVTPTGSSSIATAAAAELENNFGDIYPKLQPNENDMHSSFVNTSGGLYPQLNVDEIVVPQELGMDAAENQVAENPWEEGIEGFRRDFYSRIWMTYRREFPTMNGSNYTSDCGWGCMLRSGQMLLAQGLICHFLGRSWRYEPESQINLTYDDNIHRRIIKWFGDSSSKSSPFSIHALVHLGEELGKKPGDWYGPSSVSHLLKRALINAAHETADFDNITIYVARDCTIYLQDVEDLCCVLEPTQKLQLPWQYSRQPKSSSKKEKQHWKSLILLIPLRLGTEKLNPIYAHCLKLLLSTEHCIGIIGGRPKHSLYFVGFQEDRLIHLDPHYCQEMVDVNQENFPLHSFHCKSPRKLKTSKMDPSCSIGFYCQTRADFNNFVENVQLYLYPMRCASGTIERVIPSNMQLPNNGSSNNANDSNNTCQDMNYPLFTFAKGRCTQNQRDEMSDSLYKPLQKQLHQIDPTNQQQSQTKNVMSTSNPFEDEDGETEEFVLL